MLAPSEVAAQQKAGALVLDTRPAQEFSAGHIPDAVNIALSGQYASWAATLVGLDKDIIVTAEDEEKLEEARLRLARVGIERVAGGVEGGMAAWAASQLPVVQTGQITAEELNQRLAEVQVVDVRRPQEFVEGHIQGARLIPLNQLESRVGELDPNRPVVAHCKSGFRSAIACSLIQKAGFARVDNLIGGFDAWRACGLPEARENQVQTAGEARA
jgi:hydroxyacylglutathione hydrolase